MEGLIPKDEPSSFATFGWRVKTNLGSIWSIWTPWELKKHQKFIWSFIPPKNTLKVKFSMLNRDENVSMAQHFNPKMCQLLHNFINTVVNGYSISCLLASTVPDFYHYREKFPIFNFGGGGGGHSGLWCDTLSKWVCLLPMPHYGVPH